MASLTAFSKAAGMRCPAAMLFFLCGEQLWQASKIVHGKREGELATHAIEAAQHGLGH